MLYALFVRVSDVLRSLFNITSELIYGHTHGSNSSVTYDSDVILQFYGYLGKIKIWLEMCKYTKISASVNSTLIIRLIAHSIDKT